MEGRVLELTDSDFENEIARHETTLVMFYAPWCGHCKKLKPKFADAAGSLIANDPPVQLAQINCVDVGKETCDKHDVSGYPTLKIFRNGEFSQDYDGPRETGGLVKYMQTRVGPVSKEVHSAKELEEFLAAGNEEVCVGGFFGKESDLMDVFLKIADKFRDRMRFAHSKNLETTGLSDDIVLFRPQYLHNKFENDTVTYSGEPKYEEIETFIEANLHGLVGHRKPDNKNDFQNPLVVVYYNMDYVKDPKGTNYWRNRVLKVAKEYRNELNFAVSSKEDFKKELDEFGIDPSKNDRPVVCVRDTQRRKFKLEEPFSVEGLDRLVRNFLDGRLEPYIKSQPVPENNAALVKVAVARNFDEIVVNNGKDTFLKLYASWCGYCQFLETVLDDLAEQLKEEDVAIVKMEATENEVPPPFEVNGFPTIYWASKNSKDKPVVFYGERELEAFLKFIAEHATEELKGYDRKGRPKRGKTRSKTESKSDPKSEEKSEL